MSVVALSPSTTRLDTHASWQLEYRSLRINLVWDPSLHRMHEHWTVIRFSSKPLVKMKVNSEIDCNQWYQLIRPVVLGCHARKPSEIRTLDLAGECNAEFWSKIPWHLTEYPRKREFYSFIQSPNDEYLKELGKTELCKDIASVRKPCSAQNAANGEAVDALW